MAAARELQAAKLNQVLKDVIRVVMCDEKDSDYHQFYKQVRAQNRGRNDAKLARLCVQVASELLGREFDRLGVGAAGDFDSTRRAHSRRQSSLDRDISIGSSRGERRRSPQ